MGSSYLSHRASNLWCQTGYAEHFATLFLRGASKLCGSLTRLEAQWKVAPTEDPKLEESDLSVVAISVIPPFQ